MKLSRRLVVQLAGGAALLSAGVRGAAAQGYPARPVRWIVGFPAGGPGDMLARLFGQWLQDRLGQPFIIENRPGAGTNIATEAVIRSAPDGHTLLLVVAANAINATLYDKLSFNFISDIAPVASISREPNVMVTSLLFPAKTIPEFIAYARVNPGKITIASPGNGTPAHLAGELLKLMTGIDAAQVVYRGTAPLLTDLLSGQVDVYFGTASGSIEYVKAGKLRALGLTSATRSERWPDLPTIGEFVPGFDVSTWFGLGAPSNTPAEIIAKLNHEINAALADPKIRARIADLGGNVLPGSPADFGKLIANETEKWGKVIRAANIKPQ
jgi:tripartite-type tricarboxylate transporter receptor subunit TctC